jgi:hypothetical protein
MIAWLRANPVGGRLVVKIGLGVPLAFAAGVALTVVCDALGVSRQFAALGGAAVAVLAGTRLAGRVADRLGIPEPGR